MSLTNPVTITGYTSFGVSLPGCSNRAKCHMEFSPTPNDKGGFTWTPNNGRLEVPFNPNRVRFDQDKRNLMLCNGATTNLRAIEHLGPARFFGIQGVTFKVSGTCPPYLMPRDVIKQLEPDLIPASNQKLIWKVPESQVIGRCGRRNGKEAYTHIVPYLEGGFVVKVCVDYPGLGSYEKTYDLSTMSREDLLNIFSVGPQMWFTRARLTCPAARLLSKCISWRHRNMVVWPNFTDWATRQVTLEKFADHRFLNIVGAMSLLITGNAYPSVYIESVMSDQEADLLAIKQMRFDKSW